MTKFERIIYKSPPVVFIIYESKKIIIPGFKGLPLYDVVKFFFQQINKIGLNERAAAISFNLIQALPAALLFLFSIIPYLPESLNVKGQILGLLKDLTPNSTTYTLIQNLITELFKKHMGVFSFGFILLMYYSSNAMIGVIKAFDKSISQKKDFFFHQRWRAIQLTAILISLILASALVLIGQEQLASILKDVFHFTKKTSIPWWNAVRWIIIFAVLFFGIAFIYKFAPSVKKRWDIFSPGSILATVLTLLSTLVFSYWVNHFASYNRIYGSIGTMLIIMLLIYFNSLILLIGFELNVSITYLQAEVEKRKLTEKETF